MEQTITIEKLVKLLNSVLHIFGYGTIESISIRHHQGIVSYKD